MNDKLDTGRKCFNWFGSRPGFFRRGLTTAVLKQGGNTPDCRHLFTRSVRDGNSTFNELRNRGVGMGSSVQVVGLESIIILFICPRRNTDLHLYWI